jgi:hypothetical protein
MKRKEQERALVSLGKENGRLTVGGDEGEI